MIGWNLNKDSNEKQGMNIWGCHRAIEWLSGVQIDDDEDDEDEDHDHDDDDDDDDDNKLWFWTGSLFERVAPTKHNFSKRFHPKNQDTSCPEFQLMSLHLCSSLFWPSLVDLMSQAPKRSSHVETSHSRLRTWR